MRLLLSSHQDLPPDATSSGPVEPTDDAVIPPEKKVLDGSSTSNLTSVPGDLRTLTFSGDVQNIARSSRMSS